MTPNDAVLWCGAALFLTGIVAPLFSRFFCTRGIAPWTRHYRDVALALVGARVLGARAFDLSLDWFGALLWVNLAVAQGVVAGAHWRAVMRPRGQRCWRATIREE